MGATGMFRLAGAEVVGVEVDEEGVNPDRVTETIDHLADEGKAPEVSLHHPHVPESGPESN